jgi:PAS domain S-box-containing protein
VTKPLAQMTRAELMEEVRRLRSGEVEQTLRRTILELQVFREEVRQQNEELVDAQKRLEWTANRYAELYDSAPVGYVTFDAEGVVEEINLTGARLLGREVPHLVGSVFFPHVEDRELWATHVTRCRGSRGHDVVTELALRTASGRALPVELRTRPILAEGRMLFRTTITDLSERRRAEEERRELLVRERVAREANEAKDQFLAILSHELRNPLAAISAGASALAEHRHLPAALDETVARIRRNVMSEARLITDLLDASRLRHGKVRIERRPVDLHVVVADAIAGLRTEFPDLDVRLELGATQHQVRGDATRLGQVIANLLRNAREATRERGEIRIVTWNPSADRLVVSVIDTGRGIASDQLPHLFTTFGAPRPHREPGEGLGLGLVISKGLVEAHGGELDVRSGGAGQGARFDVELATLPKSEQVAPSEPLAEAGAEAARPHESLRILLVDDHRDTAESLAMLLEQRGFHVLLADSVASALERAKLGFDVLISDLGLPDGDGRELATRLAERGPLRAIALSGYGTDADLAASREAGFRAHLVKPVEPSRLLKVIARVAAA